MKIFGLTFTSDLFLKLLAFVFALGMLYQRLDTLETSIKIRIDSEARASFIHFSELSQRLTRVENKLDRLP